MLTTLVISFAKEVSTHSRTIEKTPACSKSFESLKIFFLSINFLPLNLKFIAD